MNAKERAIIEALIDKNDKRKHQVALETLFVGRNNRKENDSYSLATRNAVQKAFSGWRYKSFEDGEVYDTFLTFFIPYIESVDAEKLRSIENLKGWLFRVAYYCANTNRQKINEALGIDVDETPLVLFDEGWMEIEEGEQEETVIIGFNPDEETDIEWFDKLIKQYIDELPIERDRVIVKAIMLEEMDRSELAAELGITVQVLNLAFEEAWIRVLKRALPDIRYRSRKLFLAYESDMRQSDAELLHGFFTGNLDSTKQIMRMAHEHKCSIDRMETIVASSYKRLLRIKKTDDRNKRSDKQEGHCAEEKDGLVKMYKKNKAALHKANPVAEMLLGEFFYNYDGGLVEMSINKHKSMGELEKEIDYAMQLLKEIDKKNTK